MCLVLGQNDISPQFQAQNTEKAIKSEFQKLYQFLRAEEAARIDALRKEVALKSEKMNLRIINMAAEMSSLRDKIKTIEGEIKAGDVSLMKVLFDYLCYNVQILHCCT